MSSFFTRKKKAEGNTVSLSPEELNAQLQKALAEERLGREQERMAREKAEREREQAEREREQERLGGNKPRSAQIKPKRPLRPKMLWPKSMPTITYQGL